MNQTNSKSYLSIDEKPKAYKNKAFFLDRDGVVNHRLVGGYIKNIEGFLFCNGIFDLVRHIKQNNFLMILISNQQGVSKGIMNQSDLDNVTEFMQEGILQATGYNFDDIYYCTDLAGTNSNRRKPNPGMILEAAQKWEIDLNQSFMIGDMEGDMLAGKRAGTKTIFVGFESVDNSLIDWKFEDLQSIINNFAEII